jgi:hypothetical protein
MKEQFCKNCFFWTRRASEGYCHRRAPIAIRGETYLYDMSVAIKLLLWWSIREWGGDPDEQLGDYLIDNIEGGDETTLWPKTEANEWCGEWEARKTESRAQAA